jgi:hypothetical protein
LYSDGKFIRSIISECGRGEELVGLAEGLYELRAGLSKPCGICERKEFFAIKGEKVASPVPDSQIVLVALMFLLFVYSLAFNPNKKN